MRRNSGLRVRLTRRSGTITVTLRSPGGVVLPPVVAPVYNMQGLGGEVTRLGFNIAILSSNVVVTVRPGDYGLTATVPNIEQGGYQVLGSELTVWGVPGDPSHDLMRGTVCEGVSGCRRYGPPPEFEQFPVGEGAPSPIPAVPFLSNPTQCTEAPLTASLKVDSWQEREAPPHEASANLGPMTGCERVSFGPGLSVQPRARWPNRRRGSSRRQGPADIQQSVRAGDAQPEERRRDVAGRDDGQPLGGRRAGGVHSGGVRGGSARHPRGHGLPERLQPRHGRNGNAGAQGKADWLGLSRAAVRQPVPRRTPSERVAARDLRHPAPTEPRDHRQACGEDHAEPGHGPARDDVSNRTAPLQQVHAQLPSGGGRAAGDPAGVRQLQRAGRIQLVV